MKEKRARRAAAKKAWGGRFRDPTDELLESFSSSLAVDLEMAEQDIRGSIAHVGALERAKLLTRAEATTLRRGLASVAKEIQQGRFRIRPADEDVHMAVERRLTELVGPVGGKVHTGRSRNDQVATDLRLWVRDEIDRLAAELGELISALLARARADLAVILPGYTHLQRAQPVLLAHHWLAYVEMIERDRARLADARKRVNSLPLGAGALAGAGFRLDRRAVARELGFAEVSGNSLDAVSDRDFVIEYLAVISLLAMHLSRLCEEIVLWSTEEFGFLILPDAFATGSSMMPQKKNPDVAELVRGKTGRVYGALIAVLTTLKGLPLSYNRDLQEDKPPLFDASRTVRSCVAILTKMLPRLGVDDARTRAAAGGLSLATEIADYLVERGLPFREAHGVAGRIVRHCLDSGRELESLQASELRDFSPLLDAGVMGRINVESAIARRRLVGGTARIQVARRLADLERTAKSRPRRLARPRR
jgi:argininosuccinate lyase